MKPYYQDDAVTIYHADCRDISVRADLVATDPPYGEVNRKSQGLRNFDKADADSETVPTAELLAMLLQSGAASYYVWCGTEQVSGLRVVAPFEPSGDIEALTRTPPACGGRP